MNQSDAKPSKAKRKKFCLHDGCNQPGQTKGYCRTHYFAHWKEIKTMGQAKAEKRLDDFVNRLAEKYPKDYMQKIKEGLEDEEKFTQVVGELETEADPEANKESTETEREYLERLERKIKVE
ncbi:MAG: hypothetical protein HYR96_04845 [Deltaproteobacteria bacterium]|nr:hypothetical protein [Deltaproteobacteria bacterium]